jgi:hypothetical protein
MAASQSLILNFYQPLFSKIFFTANLNEKFPLNKSMLPLSSWLMLLHKQIVNSACVNNIYAIVKNKNT